MDRPDWGPGGEVRNVPAVVESSAVPDVRAAIEAGRSPTAAESAAILGNDAPAPAVPAKWDGKTRPDWNAPAARNESGQFLSKSESEMRQQWEAEGGIAHVVQVVTAKEQAMLSAAPLIAEKIDSLPKDFMLKAVDHLRLSPGYGADGFWRSVKQFEDSLSSAERDAWAKFCRSLDSDEQAALIYGLTK